VDVDEEGAAGDDVRRLRAPAQDAAPALALRLAHGAHGAHRRDGRRAGDEASGGRDEVERLYRVINDIIVKNDPAPGDALYFVARGDGSHEFSPTLEAHNRAVQKFQLHRSQ